MRLHSLLFLFKEALEGIIRHRLMALAALTTSAAGFFVFGAFLVSVYILQSITGSTLSELSFAAFMKPETKRADSLRVQNAIRKIPGVVYVRLVTKEEDWALQKRDLGFRLQLEGISENQLTDGFEIRTKRLEDMSAVAKQVRKIKGVDAVQVMTDIVSKLRAVLRLLKTLGMVATAVLLLAITLMIGNVIRLTVLARQREIRVMQLVGATDTFIRTPFLIEGIIYGVTGAAIAGVLVYALGNKVITLMMEQLLFLPINPAHIPLSRAVVLLLLAGFVIGLLGSWLSLRRFLKDQ